MNARMSFRRSPSQRSTFSTTHPHIRQHSTCCRKSRRVHARSGLQKMRGFGVSRRSVAAPCCALDEGRSLGAALQEEASNRHERLLLNGGGRERQGQKARSHLVC